MSVAEAWEAMLDWMRSYGGTNWIMLILSGGAAVYLLVAKQNVRKAIIWPIVLLIPVVINPLLYNYIYKDLRYWRFFWLLPEAVLIGLAAADVSRRISAQWAKCVVLAAVAAFVMLTGNNVFLPESGQFYPADSIRKVSPEVREACDIILADNPNPKCIFQDWLANETRQYSGEIMQLYGRDIDGYITEPSMEAVRVHQSWNGTQEEQESIFAFAKEQEYTHICCVTTDGFNEMAEAHGFSLLAETEGRSIYHRDYTNAH